MDPQPPIGPDRFRFVEQSDGDFDELTFRLVRLEYPNAVKMDAPDGGVDTLLPVRDRDGYERGWQAKRYTGNIAWAKCKASLDRAVERYGVSHYTFCFARNLTEGQEKLFVKHLVGRHSGVTVDYWNSSELVARLTGSEEGQRVAKHFFGDRDALARIERAQRAGGALANETDAHERLLAVGEFMAGHDPYFAYPTTQGERSLAVPAPPPETVMSVQRIQGPMMVRTDVIPRDAEAMERYGPQGRLIFSADEPGRKALAEVQRTLAHGGEVEIDSGVSTAFDQLPPMFADMLGKTVAGTIKITATGAAPAWPVWVTADTDRGNAALDFDLARIEPDPSWEFGLSGASEGGLTLTLRGRWLDAEERGEINVGWSHTMNESPAIEQSRALALLNVLHGTGTLRIEDRSGVKPPFEHKLAGSAYPEELPVLQALFETVAVVEGRAGVKIRIPEAVSAQEMNELALVAQCIRDGGQDVRFESMEAVCAPDSPLLAEEEITGVTVRNRLDARVLGQTVSLGTTVCEMPPLRVIHREPAPEGPPGHVLVRLAPASHEPAALRTVLEARDGEAQWPGAR